MTVCKLSWSKFMLTSVSFIPYFVFGHEVMKMQKYYILCLHFARQDGQDGKKGKKITQLKQPKYKKTNDENMG